MLKPRPTATREQVRLDGLWRFSAGDAFDAGTTLEAAVPASYNDLFTDPAIRDHVGWVWYQRAVRVPRGWDRDRILVRVEAATHEGRVYVGDTLAGSHVGGYTPFDVDVTDLVRAGGEFTLTIGVNNQLTGTTIPPGTITVDQAGRKRQQYQHDFYNYAGLHRSVWLHSVPSLHVTDVTVVTALDGTVTYDVATSEPAAVAVAILDASGTVVATGADGVATIEDPTLWRPGAGYLYTLRASIDGHDVYEQPFGVRTVAVRGLEFLINGEPFRFTGFGKHEDTAVRGKGHDDAYLVHDFQLLDWIGANSFRTSHYPYAEEVMDFADRHGIVVIDETAAVGLNLAVVSGLTGAPPRPTFSPETFGDETRAAHAQAITELIARDKNHPSVVMWSLTNEPASNEDGAREYFEPLVELARDLDPTRPLTYSAVMFATAANDRIADLFDVLSINRYYGWYVATGDLATAEQYLEADLRGWLQRFGKPIMMSEYGADTQAGLHSVWDTPWTEEYQSAFLAMHHRVFDRIEGFVGEHVWNFADFQTSHGIHRVDGNKKGVFTRDRRPKAAAHELRRRWSKATP
ncbi:beta-glucuronidase [Actinoplanes couchii]|uniref:Beta-glucuronidase n=1 Tax=Actinoplanes couchii TaxID=403638 RepID=A0ABQ3XP82_9ACTN|nr:beta-glucuronidase [Actinoplanes couchii]MDR6318624.1 beta-glucuronidase [Actinoplanes couchii]GID60232.1 beta-glucuronidase [Actinoplanes couchii]